MARKTEEVIYVIWVISETNEKIFLGIWRNRDEADIKCKELNDKIDTFGWKNAYVTGFMVN